MKQKNKKNLYAASANAISNAEATRLSARPRRARS